MTDIEIAKNCKKLNIYEIAKKIGIEENIEFRRKETSRQIHTFRGLLLWYSG